MCSTADAPTGLVGQAHELCDDQVCTHFHQQVPLSHLLFGCEHFSSLHVCFWQELEGLQKLELDADFIHFGCFEGFPLIWCIHLETPTAISDTPEKDKYVTGTGNVPIWQENK